MSKTTIRIMSGVERRLNTLIGLEVTACGHDANVAKADRAYDRLMKFIVKEIETLVQNGGGL